MAVFDLSDQPNMGFVDRLKAAEAAIATAVQRRPDLARHLVLVPHREITTRAQLISDEELWVGRGYEGLMLRSLYGPYKLGRSTDHEQYLMKLKRWFDAEATIIDTVEALENLNEATISEIGLTKRATKKENKRPKGMLGAMRVQVAGKPDTFEIGTGFTEAQRIDLWQRRDDLVGKVVTFKYQSMSEGGIARFPVFLRFHHE